MVFIYVYYVISPRYNHQIFRPHDVSYTQVRVSVDAAKFRQHHCNVKRCLYYENSPILKATIIFTVENIIFHVYLALRLNY